MKYLRRVLSEVATVGRLGGWRCGARYATEIILHAWPIVRVRSLAPADVEMERRDWTLKVLGTTVLFEDASWWPARGSLFGQVRELYGRQAYFGGPAFTIGPGQVVLDLGANAGLFTVLAARLGARVVAVDAVPQARFARNVELNGVSDRVLFIPGCLGHDREVESFGIPVAGGITMDEVFTQIDGSVDFLKCDIEGGEFDLFHRQEAWLSRVRRIALEAHLDFGDPEALRSELEASGFETSTAAPTELRADLEGMFIFAWRA